MSHKSRRSKLVQDENEVNTPLDEDISNQNNNNNNNNVSTKDSDFSSDEEEDDVSGLVIP